MDTAAGYLEENETPEEGARREARREAKPEVDIDALLAVYTLAHISRAQLMFRARLEPPSYFAGPVSLEVKLSGWNEISRVSRISRH